MGKAGNQKRKFEIRSFRKRVDHGTVRNFDGNYSYREMKNFAKNFNVSVPAETRKRIDCLQALFSAKLLRRVSINENEEYVPETISALGKIFLGNEADEAAFFSKNRIRVHDPFIVGYHPKTGNSSIDRVDKSRWNRAWMVHVKDIKSLEMRKAENRECLLLIVI